MSKGGGVQGRTISLIGCSASGAYALGPDEEEEEQQQQTKQMTVWFSREIIKPIHFIQVSYCMC